jgi:hypothetical protein
MSAVIVLSPAVVASWPVMSAAIFHVASAAGFRVIERVNAEKKTSENRVDIEVPNANIVEETLSRGQRIVVERTGVRVTFQRDSRGRFSTTVEGVRPKAELKRIGEDLSGRVVQQYTYRRLVNELQAKGFITLSEDVGVDDTIRLTVRRHEG